MDGGSIVTQPSLLTRLKDWLLSNPLATRLLFLACVALFVLCVCSTDIQAAIAENGCANPALNLRQPWRLLSYALIHVQFWHIFLNLLSFVPLSAHIERHIGTLPFLLLFLLLTASSELLRLAITSLLLAAGYSEPFHTSAIGISGQVFSFMVITVHRIPASNSHTRSIFGFFNVPAVLYPWILLLVFQVFIPNVSFWGHFCGLLTGYVYSFGYLDYLLPSKEKWSRVEASSLSSLSGYISPADAIVQSLPQSSLATEFRDAFRRSFSALRQSLQVLYYKIAGGAPSHDYVPLQTNPELQSVETQSESASPASPASPASTSASKFPGRGYKLGG